MIDTPLAVRPSGVIHERVDDEALVIDLDHGVYHAIGGGGVDVWEAFARPATVAAVAGRLARWYRAPFDVVRADVGTFAAQLEAAGLLVPASSEGSADRPEPDRRAGVPWEAPVLETFDDLANLVLRDPAYLMDENGWPHLPDPPP